MNSDELAKADLARTVYARALEKMRQMLTAVHDELEDEGDRVYLGSTNHADLIHKAWHWADALHWDEILEHTQPKTPLAETNLKLQAEVESLTADNARQASLLKQALEAIESRRSEPLFIMRDAIRNHLDDRNALSQTGGSDD